MSFSHDTFAVLYPLTNQILTIVYVYNNCKRRELYYYTIPFKMNLGIKKQALACS
jgi:hypothetical protein